MTQVHYMHVQNYHDETPYFEQLIDGNKNVTTICYYASATVF